MTTKTKASNTIFKSKEYWLIIILVASKIDIVNVECLQDDRENDYLLWSFPDNEEVRELERKFNFELPIDLNVHAVIGATTLFKRQMQFFRIRS